MRFWYAKPVTPGSQQRFSLVELILATMIIGLLSAIVVSVYAKNDITIRVGQAKVTAK